MGGSIRYTLRYTKKSDISAFDKFSIRYSTPWSLPRKSKLTRRFVKVLIWAAPALGAYMHAPPTHHPILYIQRNVNNQTPATLHCCSKCTRLNLRKGNSRLPTEMWKWRRAAPKNRLVSTCISVWHIHGYNNAWTARHNWATAWQGKSSPPRDGRSFLEILFF